MPVVSGAPKQIALNLTGIVLFSLNALTGFEKLPPLPASTGAANWRQEPVEDAARGKDREIIAYKSKRVIRATIAVVNRECSDLDWVHSNEFSRISCQSSSERI